MKREITIPTELSELTVQQYSDFVKVQELKDSDEFIAQKMVSIFCKLPLSAVGVIKYTSIAEILQSFEQMFNKDKKFIQRFELGGKEFGFIPSLEDITMDEYVDLETNISSWDTMHKAMAVMYRPITSKRKDKYDIEPYMSTITYSEVMKFAPLDVAFGAMVFFYRLRHELLKGTIVYLEEEMKKMSTQNKRSSQHDGDGIAHSLHLLKETYSNLIALEDYPLLNVYLGSHTKSNELNLTEN